MGKQWGEAGAPLLPRPLRALWAQNPLPDWVCNDLGLPPGATYSMLGADVRPPAGPDLERVRQFLALLIATKRETIGAIPAVGEPWPVGLEFSQVPWLVRTRNCFAARGLHKNPSNLPYMTYEEILHLRGMGPLSVLDFSCTLESAIESARSAPAAWPEDVQKGGGDFSVPAELLQVLEEPWADQISECDPRFADLLPAGRGTIAERVEELIANPSPQLEFYNSLSECLPRVRARLAELERLPLEVLLSAYLEAVAKVSDKRLRPLIARLNWGGAPAATTLEEAAATVGLTRERLRQIQARFERIKPPHPVVMPALDKALTLLESRLPIPAQSAADALVAAGLANHPFHPASLLAAAKACGRAPALHLETARGVVIVVALPSGPLGDRVARVAYRQAKACGASNVMEVAAEIAARDGTTIAAERVLELLKTHSDVEFLTKDWFWCPSRTNDSVSKMSRRVLAVTSPVDVETLREGIRRWFRFRQSMARKKGALLMVPPRAVLHAYYNAHPDFVVLESGLIKSARPLDYRAELPPIEQAIVDVLRSTPTSVLDRAELVESCAERGANAHSIWTMLSYSPVVESLGSGLWTVRGGRVDPAAVEAIRRSNQLRPRERRVLDFGWSTDGRLWVAVRLPATRENQVFGIPAGAKRYLVNRDFQAVAEDGTESGRVRVYDTGASTGYGAFLERSGADEGDILLAKFDLVKEVASLSLTDDEGLEELSPET